jgi:hypothetical protein
MEQIEELPVAFSILQKVTPRGRVVLSSLLKYVCAIFSTFIELSVGGISLLAFWILRQFGVNDPRVNLLTRGLTGALIALPLLVLCSGLFCSANHAAGKADKIDPHQLMIRPKSVR